MLALVSKTCHQETAFKILQETLLTNFRGKKPQTSHTQLTCSTASSRGSEQVPSEDEGLSCTLLPCVAGMEVTEGDRMGVWVHPCLLGQTLTLQS